MIIPLLKRNARELVAGALMALLVACGGEPAPPSDSAARAPASSTDARDAGDDAAIEAADKAAHRAAEDVYALPNVGGVKWTGDLDGMIQRRIIRVLTTYSRVNYFVDQGRPRGLVYDAFRLFEQPPKSWSWWDYRNLAFRKNQGLRIDHILVSEALRPRVAACSIDKAPRKNERPSDHAPVLLELSD